MPRPPRRQCLFPTWRRKYGSTLRKVLRGAKRSVSTPSLPPFKLPISFPPRWTSSLSNRPPNVEQADDTMAVIFAALKEKGEAPEGRSAHHRSYWRLSHLSTNCWREIGLYIILPIEYHKQVPLFEATGAQRRINTKSQGLFESWVWCFTFYFSLIRTMD